MTTNTTQTSVFDTIVGAPDRSDPKPQPILLTHEEINAIFGTQTSINVRPAPGLADALDPDVNHLRARLECTAGNTASADERRLDCIYNGAASNVGASASDDGDTMMSASIVCSLKHEVPIMNDISGDAAVPCIIISSAKQLNDDLFQKANWKDAIDFAMHEIVAASIVCENPNLPLKLDAAACLKQRYQSMACCSKPSGGQCPASLSTPWGPCTKLCGSGTQERTTSDGETLTRPCNTQPCCSYGGCKLTDHPCSVTFEYKDKDGQTQTKTVTAGSNDLDKRIAMAAMGQDSALDGRTVGIREPMSLACDPEGVWPTPPACSYPDVSCDNLSCDLSCNIVEAGTLQPATIIQGFPESSYESACGAMLLAARDLCSNKTGASTDSACAAVDIQQMTYCRGSAPQGMVVVDPPNTSYCLPRAINMATIDPILQKIDELIRSGNNLISTRGLLHDMRCCNAPKVLKDPFTIGCPSQGQIIPTEQSKALSGTIALTQNVINGKT